MAAGVNVPLDHSHSALSTKRPTKALVKLAWTQWKRSFRGAPMRVIGLVISLLYGLGIITAISLGLSALAFSGDTSSALPLALVGIGAALILMWPMQALLTIGASDPLDPRMFSPLGRQARDLMPGMLLASVFSPGTVLSILALTSISIIEIIYALHGGAVSTGALAACIVLVPLMGVVALLMCVMPLRALRARASARSSSRRSRELFGVLAVVGVFAVAYGASLLMQMISDQGVQALIRALIPVLTVAAWTPLGAPFAAPLTAAAGHPLEALAQVVIAVAPLAVLWVWWRHTVTAALGAALMESASSASTRTSPLVPRFLRPGPFGASAGRALRYWKRDSRYVASVLVVPIVIVFLTVLGMIQKHSVPMSLIMIPLMLAILGTSLANELGYDGPARWTIITAGLPVRTDLAARLLVMLIVSAPILLVGGVVSPLLLGRPEAIAPMLLISLGALCSTLGVSLLMSALFPYATPAPGTNLMSSSGSLTGKAFVSGFLSLFLLCIPQIPVMGLLITGLVTGKTYLLPISGLVSLVIGAIVLLLCLRFASALIERRQPDIFQQVRSFTS